MNRNLHLIVLLGFFTTYLTAQSTVFPGDANANGIVDQYDIPQIGYAIGAIGPARIQNDDASVAQAIPQFWGDNFPTGLNLIHADADGNGAVNIFDFFTWVENFGIIHDFVTPLELSPNEIDAPSAIRWNNGAALLPMTSNGTAEIPIDFIIDNLQQVNGAAFRIKYHPPCFSSVNFSSTNNWLKADGNGISLQNTAPGEINIGMTRLGNNPVNGGGTGGTLSIIIISDMVDLLETAPDTMSTWLKIEGMQLMDGHLDPIPISVDSFEIKLYRPGVIAGAKEPLNELGARLYPNPSNGPFSVSAAHPIEELTIFDGLGRVVYYEYLLSPRKSWELPELNLEKGYYHVKIEGAQGISLLKLLQQ
ncbi:T9SS type A sorting domain-containing protein [Lewinella sp. LCG006]|uniref:T9SS type A sorting domain-containing protein n=1 Tax=Lewinella sp. LCG006 TaxID=3231911 RepID=UPI0034608112